MEPYVRHAKIEDLPEIIQLIEEARHHLAVRQIPQWQNGTGPTQEVLEEDIILQRCYVLILETTIVGIGVISEERDVAYEGIQKGDWLGENESYASLHRIAIAANQQGKGLAVKLLCLLAAVAETKGWIDIRIDTHPQNRMMQKVIERSGFVFRGEVELKVPDGERYAYQRLLEN